MNNKTVKIVGAGLAGCEAALTLASLGVDVVLYDIKPKQYTPAHKSPNFAELVCSNSLKSDTTEFATGVLKQELRMLNSFVLGCAYKAQIPAGKTLTVNRESFSSEVTKLIKNNPKIKFVSEEIDSFDNTTPTIIATGPLTTQKLSEYLSKKLGLSLYFYDAVAPIISADSIDKSKVFMANKFDDADGDYINCPMDKTQYVNFVQQLTTAQRVPLKSFEDQKVFEGCMPVEVMAQRGLEVLKCGPLKAQGLTMPNGQQPYACVQLRKEDAVGNAYNMVGFQTNLTFPEQKRIFTTISGLEKAEFLRYGVMHRNSYINAPKLLNSNFQLKQQPNVFFAGQISGVEGYVESIASGLVVGLEMYCYINNLPMLNFTTNTALGALANYLQAANPNNFQPMHINWGLFAPIDCPKQFKKEKIAERSKNYISNIYKEISKWKLEEQQ